MGSTGIGNGEYVWSPDGDVPQSIITIGSNLASNLFRALRNRQRFDYSWPNAGAMGSQTGMVQGSRGYQVDQKTEWIFDSGDWRLALPYAEFYASVSQLGDNVDVHSRLGDFTIDNDRSTDKTFVTPSGNGQLTIVQPGIYSVSSVTSIQKPAVGRTFLQLNQNGTIFQRVSIPVGEDSGSVAAPAVRTVAGNEQVQFELFKRTGEQNTVTTRVRVARIG